MECPFTFHKLTTDVASGEVQSYKVKCFTVAVATLFVDMNTRRVVVFKSCSNRDYIYMDICKKKKEMYLWCVSSWRLFFKVNRSNLCLESPCFFMPKGAELRDHYRISYWDITRKHFSFCVCFDVYYTSSSCFYVSLFCILFILILKAMSIFFLWNMCLALGIYNIWGTISCSVLLYCVKQQKKTNSAPHRQWDVLFKTENHQT